MPIMHFKMELGVLAVVMFIGVCAAQQVHPTHGHGHVVEPVDSGLRCPEKGNWTLFGASCYDFRTETYNWFHAKVVCREMDSKLVEVETAEEQAFLVRMINHTYTSDPEYVWIGMQDFQEEGQWVWSTTLLPATPSFWLPREPEDKHGEEDCGGIVSGGWFDTNCEDWKNTFVCETEAIEIFN